MYMLMNNRLPYRVGDSIVIYDYSLIGKPYKEYKDIFECDLVLWHNLVIRKSIIDNWVLTENYNYFWYDGLFRSKIKQSGYSCVGLGWDAYHYASNESIALYPDYTNFIGASIFNNKYVITDKNLTKII